MLVLRRLIAVFVALFCVTGSSITSSADAQALESSMVVGSSRVELTFNDPLAAGGVDWAHLDKFVRLIKDAPNTATIRIGIHYLAQAWVANEIIAAKNRGVTVNVVLDGKHTRQGAETTLIGALGALLRVCGSASTGGGCISSDSGGYMHAKYMLLSQTKDSAGTLRSNVVWVSSANLTQPSGAQQFNSSVTVYGDGTLYSGYLSHVWNPMWARNRNYPNNDYYVASMPRGYFGSATSNSTVFVSPEQNTDQILGRLNNIDPDSNCRIRVMHASFSDGRSAVADKLVSLKAGGCKIWIMVGNSSDAMSPSNLTKFKNAGISVHKGKIHDKMILVSEGANNAHTWVLFGSQNLTEASLRKQDNLLMRLEDNQAMYDAFYAHFNRAYNNYPAA